LVSQHKVPSRRGLVKFLRQVSSRYSSGVAQSSRNIEPDLWLQPPAGGAKIAVFGTVHADTNDTRIGDFIIENSPKTVVVETALNPSHGSETGNSINLENALKADGIEDRQTFGMASVAARLRDSSCPIQESETWNEMVQSNMIYSEHLAYVAALSVDANLVFGDRPKMVTYRRMLCCPTLADLDAAFGIQCWSNYHDILSDTQLEKNSDVLTEKILFQERDAVLLKSLHDASIQVGGLNGEIPDGQDQEAMVVGVVGSSHIPGMAKLWDTGSWTGIAAHATEIPAALDEDPRIFGIRRALFDAVIRMTCRGDVSMDAAMTLGPPPPEAMDAYELTSELYGSTRMLLATLSKEQLEMVCSGWNCSPWEFLEPLRRVRPSNGGQGYDVELVEDLRTLNFELS
jgi:hypothetical protein